jgi:hypothetical protein
MSERETPYDVVFRRGRIDFEGGRFDDVRAEAEQRGMVVDDPERFVMLGSVGALLREMVLDEAAADDSGDLWQALPPQAIAQMGALLYHAYRFREAGTHVLTIGDTTARALAANEAAPNPAATPLPDAGYVQLPRNLFWARADEDGAAEPLDGFFFARGLRTDILLALGVRPRRPGFTAIPLAVDADLFDRIADERARDDGADFGNILPGGEIDGLFGLTSAAEALKLAALALRWLEGR